MAAGGEAWGAARQVDLETVSSPPGVTQLEDEGAGGLGVGGGQGGRASWREVLLWDESGAQGGLVPPAGLELLTSE